MTNEPAIPNSGMLEIRNIPTELIFYAIQQWLPCNKYAKKTGRGNSTNHFIKAVSVWLILKNETTSGQIKGYRLQLPALAAKCKMSVRTLDKYIAWLKQEDLVHMESKNLFLHEYKALGKRYGFNIKQRFKTVYYDTTDNTSLGERIIAIGIALMQEKWMSVYWNKLIQNPDQYNVVRDLLISHGAPPQELEDPENFRFYHLEAMLQAYEQDKPGQTDFLILHKTVQANPDINCKEATYGRKFGYAICEKEDPVTHKDESSCMGFHHLKHRLAKKGLITLQTDHVEGACRARKDEKVFHHRYSRRKKRTIWFRCTQITVNSEVIFGRKTAA